jgi:glyoxylase-like metal-dependent hydrolase (beta-lactamase superfamily II)
MAVETIAPGVHLFPLGFVNVVFLDDDNGPIIVDTGMPDSADKILEGLNELGHASEDVQKIVVTHKHIDHAGSLAALKQATKAPAVMHQIDAASVRKGEAILPVKSSPGLFSKLMAASMRMFSADLAPVAIEEEVNDGDRLSFAGGIEVIHTPGHSAGHISLYLPRDGGILIVGDAAIHVMGLRYPPIFEDITVGMASLRRLAGLRFNTAVFMHGKPLNSGASRHFFNKWGQ